MGSTGLEINEVECLIIGAGFGAITLLHKLQQQGFDVRVYEKGSSFGGIWHWNCYPGARVDTDTPIYQLFDKELWEDFTFRERYAGWQELRRYFAHVDQKWGVSKYFGGFYSIEPGLLEFADGRDRMEQERRDGHVR
jgi:cation diffusion facilitator CzcD-associated flavoprotein CzcO